MILLNKFIIYYQIDGMQDLNVCLPVWKIAISMKFKTTIDAIIEKNKGNCYHLNNEFIIKTIHNMLSIKITKRYITLILDPNCQHKAISLYKNEPAYIKSKNYFAQKMQQILQYYRTNFEFFRRNCQ